MGPPPVDLETIMKNKLAVAAMTPMGVTSENVAAKYNVTRNDQDTMAAESNKRALAAQKVGTHFWNLEHTFDIATPLWHPCNTLVTHL
jgi:acetyl-CoA acetyltransferase